MRICATTKPQIAQFQDAHKLMWAAASQPRVGEGRSPSQDVVSEAVSAEALCDEMGRLSVAMVPPVTIAKGNQRALGSRVDTQWGMATVMSVAPNGGYMCTWDHLDGEFQLEWYGDNDVVPRSSKRAKRYITETASCVE